MDFKKRGVTTIRVLLISLTAMISVLSIGGNMALAELEPQTKEEIQQAVDEYLAKKQAEEGLLDKLPPLLKGGRFTLSGELEYEYIDVENDKDIAESEPHFALDKLVLHPRVYLNKDIYLDAQLYFQPHKKTSINEFHIMFENFPCPSSYVDAGLFERDIKNHSHRSSEGYPLIGTAFWRDDQYAVSLGGEWSFLYWSLLVGDGLELGEKQVAEDKSYKIIHDNTKEDDFTGLSEFNANLGYRNDYGDLGRMDLLLFYVYKELSDEDIEFLQDISGYNGDTDDDNGYRYGFGADYRIGGLRVYGQYIAAEDGKLERSGWYIQPSYKLKLDQVEYFKAYEVLFRYGELDIDLWPDSSDSYSWNRQKIAIAFITQVYTNLKLKTEYYINDEDTGDEEIDNDELLVQLEFKF